MSNVEILTITPEPMAVISNAAGTSYGRNDISPKRVIRCFTNGHMSVFEHASVTLYISGISRACSHQLVRHRMASFVQKSQRYTKIDTDNNDWFVVPPEIEEDPDAMAEFQHSMSSAASQYQTQMALGMKPEDARYVLPEATKTDITMTMNVRELFHFFDLRCDPSAQWEIRYLADGIKDLLLLYNESWKELILLYEEGQ